MAGKVEFKPRPAVKALAQRLAAATDIASAEGADRAREIAPLGQARGRATGSQPRFFSVRLLTLRQFAKSRKFKRSRETVELTGRLSELRSLNRAELIGELKASDIRFFRFSEGSHKGERPDELKILPARGPGGLAVKGAVTTYRPGRLRRGIQPLPTKVRGSVVTGGYISKAPYSVFVEKGFHHKGGTEVEGKHFMKRSSEDLRPKWNRGQFLKE